MLKAVGAKTMADLLRQVPDAFRLDKPLDIGPALDELSLKNHLSQLAGQNNPVDQKVCFLGAGAEQSFQVGKQASGKAHISSARSLMTSDSETPSARAL